MTNPRPLIRKLVALADARGWGDPADFAMAISNLIATSPNPSESELTQLFRDQTLIRGRADTRAAIAEVLAAIRDVAPDASGDSARLVDVVIMTALPVEAAAVVAELRVSGERVGADGAVYVLGEYGSSSPILVAVAQSQPGNEDAAIQTERALVEFNPSAVLFVGVAGGLKAEVSRGDIVVGNHVYAYAGAKEDASGSHPRARELRPGHAILQRALVESTREDWRASGDSDGAIFVKPIAAGPRVVASTVAPTAIWLKEHFGDALAVEMEGYGFLAATAAHGDIQALVVRGISDLVDNKTADADEEWQPLSASRAARFGLWVVYRWRRSINDG